MSTIGIVDYYTNLLIIQYNQKPKASGTIATFTTPLIQPQTTVQVISINAQPNEGSYRLLWGEVLVSPLSPDFSWDFSAADIQSRMRSTTGLETITVSGTFADASSDWKITVTFDGVPPVAAALSVAQNGIADGGIPIPISIEETDETLPLAVQNGYNLTGDNIASGVQLDVLGKYTGVTRTAKGFTRQITLNDADFLSLIKIAIIKNSAQSDLATIQELLYAFFPGQIYVFDYKNMRMSYLVSSLVGSQDLVELFITQKLLPVPMAVQVAVVIYAPVIDRFFGFCDYTLPVPLGGQSPMNDWTNYNYDAPWLDYANGLFPV